ncbi:hypothetical protein TNCV_4125221 [Trichonephila clavipes]|nr:hypothetical protein TNCV_4125221 [Trichonephila clavipes]
MTVYDNKEIDNDGDEVQLLTACLIQEGLNFATSMEQHFLTHDSDIKHALKLKGSLKFQLQDIKEGNKSYQNMEIHGQPSLVGGEILDHATENSLNPLMPELADDFIIEGTTFERQLVQR